MKKVFPHILFFITCFYFLSAGNSSLFSKIGKATPTEITDLDEDSSGAESKDNKEDGCDEETFFDCNHILLIKETTSVKDLFFSEKKSSLPQHIQEKTSPPPKA
ncbi:MAG TPA: hypothetical protein VNZ49_11560 [Bacteroidia bacterium]|jgi:hypothetical protein|nr:hypothetical protein [Bacteroidia bacterium]